MPKSNSVRKIKRQTKDKLVQVYLPVMSNDPRPELTERLRLLYHGAERNKLGLLEARRKVGKKGGWQPVQLIVGMQQGDNGNYTPFPIAMVITEIDQLKGFEFPDLKGGWVPMEVSA